ncbi:MAG TPA: alpha-(1-_3)-arabinofuranosyltransferase family protein, partial [Acidimicrobiales bacterium]
MTEPTPTTPTEVAPRAPVAPTGSSGPHHAPDGLGPPPPTERGERIALAVLVAAVAVVVVGSQWGRFAPDTRPDLYQQPGRLLASSLQAWVGGANGLGQGNFNTGLAPVAAVVWVLRTVGTPVWLAVRIWRLAILLVGAWGIRRYLGALFGDRLTAAGRFAATVFWLANPYLIVGGNSTPILLPYALLPWTLLALVR